MVVAMESESYLVGGFRWISLSCIHSMFMVAFIHTAALVRRYMINGQAEKRRWLLRYGEFERGI